ncbi:MAG: hypothetical protein KJO88_06060 [Gammaproteobacteria bacterium]|nr:hypothetical protein [Gammaproteobacteria bacterium]
MKEIKIYFIFYLFLHLLLVGCNTNVPVEYSRSDCIVEVKIIAKDVEKILTAIGDNASKYISTRIDKFPIATVRNVNNGTHGLIYYQLFEMCEKKNEVIQNLFFAVKNDILPGVSFTHEISKKNIKPDIDTIDQKGEYWRD